MQARHKLKAVGATDGTDGGSGGAPNCKLHNAGSPGLPGGRREWPERDPGPSGSAGSGS